MPYLAATQTLTRPPWRHRRRGQPEAPDAAKAPTGKPGEGDTALLNGPALPGEGVYQDDVDAMFDGDADATEAPAAAAEPGAEDFGGESSQDDIDALFD